MILAAYRDNGYNFVLLIHIAAFLVAFAPAVLNPLLASFLQQNGGDPVVRSWIGFAADYTKKISLPALVALLITGGALVGMSDDVLDFSQTWLMIASIVWLAIGGVVSAVILKGEKQVAAGDSEGIKLVETGGKIATLLMVVMLYLMVFKPGL